MMDILVRGSWDWRAPSAHPTAKSRVAWTEGPSHRKSPVALCVPNSGLMWKHQDTN